jgi:hypothetical protein
MDDGLRGGGGKKIGIIFLEIVLTGRSERKTKKKINK